MKSVLVLQHAACETLGTIEDSLHPAGLTSRYIRAFAGEPLPSSLGEAAGLIVMGGPQSVYAQARFPYLRDEMRLIEQTLCAEKPVLGICLGSQLLAAALGAPVRPGRQKEIGWFEVALADAARQDSLFSTAPATFMGFHWHGDVFALPKSTVGLASTTNTPHQAFRYQRNAYGLLFHMEITAPQVAEMVAAFPDELHAAGVDARTILSGVKHHADALRRIGAQVYGAWAELL